MVQTRDAATLLPIIQRHVAPGTVIHSDQWRAYTRIHILFTKSLMDYIHNLCHVGLAMQQIEISLVRNRAKLFYRLREQFMHLSLATGN